MRSDRAADTPTHFWTMRAIPLVALCLLLASPSTAQGGVPLWLAGEFSLTTGVDYSDGGFGDTEASRTLFVPVTLSYLFDHFLPTVYENDLFELKLTVPWVQADGPGVTGQGAVGDSVDDGRRRGLGDVSLGAAYLLFPPVRSALPALELSTRIKIPTAASSNRQLLGTGSPSYSVQLDLYKRMGRVTPLFTLGYRFAEDDEFALRDALFTSVGAAVRLGEALSAGLLYDWHDASSRYSNPRHELFPYCTIRLRDDLRLTPLRHRRARPGRRRLGQRDPAPLHDSRAVGGARRAVLQPPAATGRCVARPLRFREPMQTFLIALLGVVAGIALLGAVAFLWIRRKVRKLGRSLGEALQHMASASGVPPFAITLRRGGRIDWSQRRKVDAVARHFEMAGYQHVGDYAVPELPGVQLRALWHPGTHAYAVVYDHVEAGVYADVVRFFRDESVLLVTSAPETGLDDPTGRRTLRLDVDLEEPSGAHFLHDTSVQESGQKTVIPATAEHFPRAFIGSYALEMDWRIARGGPSADEIRAAARVAGEQAPDDAAVAQVQRAWRSAISQHHAARSHEVYLAQHPMSAQEWELKRERIFIVNDWIDVDEMASSLAWSAVEEAEESIDDDAMERMQAETEARIRGAFDGTTPREGFRALQSLLPEKRRYEHLATVEEPPADVYLAPDDAEV